MCNQISDENSLLETIDNRQGVILAFLQDLLRYESICPIGSEAEVMQQKCQEYIAGKLRKIGCTIDMWEPDYRVLESYKGGPGYIEGRSFKGRPNVVGTLTGAGGGRSIILNGHIDVVSPEPISAWRHDPWKGKMENGRVYGRGASDMKGGVAAMIMALECIKEVGIRLRGGVIVESVIDEEKGGMGTLACCQRGYTADAGIVTEPTNLEVQPICHGILWGKVKIRGRSGHIEFTQPHWSQGGAVSAIEKADKIMHALQELSREWSQIPVKNNPLLPRPCEISISMIQGGEWPASYPEECSITFDAQYLPAEMDERGMGSKVKKEIEEYVHDVSLSDPWLRTHTLGRDRRGAYNVCNFSGGSISGLWDIGDCGDCTK